MKEYDHNKIEKKWQKEWETKKTYQTFSSVKAKGKKPFSVIDMFPYPSGVGLHVGHPRGYIGSDVIARQKRMQGFNVLHPMGYDAFGLPAEQYAIQNKVHPKKAVQINAKTFEKQLNLIGLSYDWSRKVDTTDTEFYKWTQWMFLKIYDSWFDTTKNKARPISELIKIFEKNGNFSVTAFTNYDGVFSAKEWKLMDPVVKQSIIMQYRLAYEGNSEVNWCPHLGTVLANDEIVESPEGPVSERGGYPVEKKLMRQWFMRITAYADRLIKDLDGLDWPENIKEVQKNWIGKSEGSEIDFKIKNSDEKIRIFTTRADTIFGATYIVLAPEHVLVHALKKQIHNIANVEHYIRQTKKKDEIVRVSNDKEKTGVELKGITAINPANNEEIPVWIADYVLPQYGTGAVMAVPAHDERDFLFANKFNLPVRHVIEPLYIQDPNPELAFVHRHVISAVIKHWSEDKYLGLKWKKVNWGTFVTGGVEDGEDPEASAVREIQEETGYLNLRLIKKLPACHSKFYHMPKKQNRFAHFSNFYFELIDGERNEISDEEKENHEIVWLDPNEVDSFLTPEGQKRDFKIVRTGKQASYHGSGILCGSEEFSGMESKDACKKITEKVGGKIVTKYKLRDAVFARQRYWGEPIPLFKDKTGLIHEVPEKKLPLVLPVVKSYEPSGNGEGPLANVPAWKKAGFETNTMPGWAGSSWYFLRYTDPKNKKVFADKKELNYWYSKKNHGGVNVYIGGAEHTTGHLLYSRFWHKVLFDYGLVPNTEPFQLLKNQGMILASDGRKMSKRWGNVVNPDDVVKTYGADTLRLYEMFMGPFEATLPWSTESIIGSRRFIERVWRFAHKVQEKKSKKTDANAEMVLHRTIKKVTDGIASFSFNTAVSAMMICMNEMEKGESVAVSDCKFFVQMLAPFAPHVAEDLWHMFGEKKSVHLSSWPIYDEKKTISEDVKVVVQVNGKFRAVILVKKNTLQETIETLAKKDEKVITALGGRNPQKVIYVPDKLINFVV